MNKIALLCAFVVSASQLQAQAPADEYTISKDGIGPFIMKTFVSVDGKVATFSGSARNDSGQSVRQAAWCVQGSRQHSGCALSLWTTAIWKAGETIEWNVTAPAGYGLPQHTVSMTKISLEDGGCLIVKHKGTLGRRLMMLTVVGLPLAPGSKYDLVDSLNMQGTGARPTYTGKNLQELLDRGVRVIILQTKAKAEDVKGAQDACQK
jgi:hypothetical protein